MKITIDIDCTPAETRAFFGLPDVAPMQEAMMKEVEDRLRTSLSALDPEAFVKMWLPTGMQGFEQIQKAFWSNMAGATAPKST